MIKGGHKPGALIAGGHFSSLGAARNLGRHGIQVFIMDSEPCISRYSRYTERFFHCPPEKEEVAYVSFIKQLASVGDVEGCVLFPSTDEQVRIFAQNRQSLSEIYIVSVPDWEITRHLYDKRLTNAVALRQQIPTPKTAIVNCEQDLESLDMDFPLVIKPAITPHLVSKTKKKAYRADHPEELIAIYRRVGAILAPEEILIQEFIPGGAKNLFSYFGYFKEGRPVIGYSARRLRQHPMEFGRASTYAVSACIPELETLATYLMTGIGYTGLAEVEFMFNTIHSRFEFLEVNPRLWGWHTLSIIAGVDLPYIAYTDLIGEPDTSGNFREGAKWLHLATDVPTAFLEICHGRLTIGEYLRSIRSSQDAVLCADDPMPFIAEMLLIPYLAVRRGL